MREEWVGVGKEEEILLGVSGYEGAWDKVRVGIVKDAGGTAAVAVGMHGDGNIHVKRGNLSTHSTPLIVQSRFLISWRWGPTLNHFIKYFLLIILSHLTGFCFNLNRPNLYFYAYGFRFKPEWIGFPIEF